MNYYRKNADRDIRELQRRAAGGDVEASDQLVIEDLRSGRTDYESAVGIMVVSRGPVLGWRPSWEYPGFLQLTPPAPWDKSVVIFSTPWWEREGTSFSPLSLAAADGSSQESLRDLFTPNTGDLQADVANYIDQLSGAIMALSFAGAAGLQAYMSYVHPETVWDSLGDAARELSEGLRGA